METLRPKIAIGVLEPKRDQVRQALKNQPPRVSFPTDDAGSFLRYCLARTAVQRGWATHA
jgi:hypothetical protein